MSYLPYIADMFREIRKYNGNFGDPIEWGPYSPIDVLQSERLPEEEHLGVSISLVCLLATAIDNSTLINAQSEYGETVRELLANGKVSRHQLIVDAVNAFLGASEEYEFGSAIESVYRELILIEQSGGSNAA